MLKRKQLIPDLIILLGTLVALWMIRSWMVAAGTLRPGLGLTIALLAPWPPLAYVGLRVADERVSRRFPVAGPLSNLGLLQFMLPMLLLAKLPTMGSPLGILLVGIMAIVAGFSLRSGPARFDDNEAEAGRESRQAILRTAGGGWMIAGLLVALLGIFLMGIPGGGGLMVPVGLVVLLIGPPLAASALAVSRLRT